MSTIEIVDPRGHAVSRSVTLSERLDSLEGKTVGLLNNRKWNVTKLYELLSARLADEYGVRTVERLKETPAKVCSSELRGELIEEVDALVSGVGDCGSCSACSLRDAVWFEENGLPAVTLITTEFIAEVERTSEILGVVDPVVVALDHPMAGIDEEGLGRRVEEALDGIVKGLTRQPVHA